MPKTVGINTKNICFQVLSTGSMRSELALLYAYFAQLGMNVGLAMGHSGYLASDRNTGINQWLNGGREEFLIQVDEDMSPPLDIMRLAAYKKDIVGSTYICHSDRGFMIATKGFDLEHKNCKGKGCDGCDNGVTVECVFPRKPKEPVLKRVDWVGTGAYCISRKAAKRMIKKYGSVFQFDVDEHGFKRQGTDVLMCRKAREIGLKVWLDRSMIAGHIKKAMWTPLRDGQLTMQKWGTYWLADNVPACLEDVIELPELVKLIGIEREDKAARPKR